MKTTETKKTPRTSPAAQDRKIPDRQWDSFPKPRGWSMGRDERGLVPGRPGPAKSQPGDHHTSGNPTSEEQQSDLVA